MSTNQYGKGKRSKRKHARRLADQRLRELGKQLNQQHYAGKLDDILEPETPDEIMAWLNRPRRGREEPSKLQAERPLSETVRGATGSNKTRFTSKAPHSNPQCALGYNVD